MVSVQGHSDEEDAKFTEVLQKADASSYTPLAMYIESMIDEGFKHLLAIRNALLTSTHAVSTMTVPSMLKKLTEKSCCICLEDDVNVVTAWYGIHFACFFFTV